MRMAELSDRSGIPVATVKYYLREGLLPAGERTSPNQARYGESHLQRLKLVKALTDVGGMSLASVKAVLSAIDDEQVTPHQAMGVVQEELAGTPPKVADEAADRAFAVLDEIVRRNGWGELKRDHVIVANLVAALATAGELGHEELTERLEQYAHLALRVAEVDLGTVKGLGSVDRIIETGLVVTVLGDRTFAALRHLGQELLSREILRTRP